MNTHALAAEIVTKIRNSMQDSSLNQALVVERLIREAMDEDWRETTAQIPPQTIPDPTWPPKSPEIHC